MRPLAILMLGVVLALALVRTAPAQGLSDNDLRDLSIMLDTGESRFRRGEIVPLSITVANSGKRPITLPFSTTQRFDFQIYRDHRLVWKWSKGERFVRDASPVVLGPGEKVTFSATWSQISNNGVQVGPGNYSLVGFVNTLGRRPLIRDRIEIVR